MNTGEHLELILTFCRSRLALPIGSLNSSASRAGWRATIEGIQCARAALRDLELVPPGHGSTIKSLMEGALRMILAAYPLELLTEPTSGGEIEL